MLTGMGVKRRVVVTGLGVVTSLSCDVEDLWKRILAGESGIHRIRLFDLCLDFVQLSFCKLEFHFGDDPVPEKALLTDVVGLDLVRLP